MPLTSQGRTAVCRASAHVNPGPPQSRRASHLLSYRNEASIMERARPSALRALIPLRGPCVAENFTRLAAALCGVLLASSLAAQAPAAGKAIVTGVVRDAESQTPIPGVVVSIPGTPLQGTT